jgi:RimJ/RimL family protein N-acetyltransferase
VGVKIIETERLWLRKLHAGDAGFMLGLLNEPSFIRNIGDRGVRTIEAARQYILDGAVASYESNGYGLYLVELKEGATPIGICGLVKRTFLADPDIGFAFMPAYWSHGYAYESAAAVMHYAHDTLGLPRVVAIASADNAPSFRLLAKLGLVYQGMIDAPDAAHRCAYFVPAVADRSDAQARATCEHREP